MIGNSFTDANNLADMVAEVLCRSGLASNVRVDAFTQPGAGLPHWLGAGTQEKFAGHDVVVLQDQSQIPGFGATAPAFAESLSAARQLGTEAAEAHARVLLFQTWGYEYGDSTNEMIYPSYRAMQRRLNDGYASYLEAARAATTAAAVAPVGQAWAWVKVHAPSLFGSLYDRDGRHPSPAGSYLAALVIAKAISGHQLPPRLWAPPNVSPALASTARLAARATR
jgi:hypothetical protein